MNSVNLSAKIHQNQIAFGAQAEERHPRAAIASLIIPGSGQLMKGDKKRGQIHLVIWLGLAASSMLLYTKKLLQNVPEYVNTALRGGTLGEMRAALYKGFSKTRIAACIAIGVAFAANAISSMINAYKGTTEKSVS